MSGEAVMSGSLAKPESDRPTSRAKSVTNNLAGDVNHIPLFTVKRVFSVVPCYDHSQWQHCSPPHNIKNPMYLLAKREKKNKKEYYLQI